jgi:predicted Zn-dependent protease
VGSTSRVRCTLQGNRTVSATTYWVTEGGKLRLESLGRIHQLALLAWRASEARDVKAAAAWVSWALDELSQRGDESGAVRFLHEYWGQADRNDPRAVRYAAAVAQVVFTDQAEKAPAPVMAELDHGRAQLSGALRRAADNVLVNALTLQEKFDAAIHVLEPLARSENEPWMWRLLASLESKAGRFDRARARIDAALKKDPSSAEWRQTAAVVALRGGKYDDAARILEELDRDKGSGVDVRNNLHWSRLMAGKLDEETERDTLRMAGEKDASEAAIHTAAMILLERGRLLEAAELSDKRHLKLNGEPDGAQWLLRGRLLQLLGFADAGREAYAKVGKDPELADLARRYQGK